MLLNIYHKISDSYEPFVTKINGTVDVYLHEDVAEHYVEMARAAARDGITLNVEYGFIERYREGDENITHFNACPWHRRYVGTDASDFMQTYRVTLEEYVGEID